MEKYNEIEKIGEGTFGRVFKAVLKKDKNKDTNNKNNLIKVFAIKRIEIESGKGISRATIREIKALKKMKHKNIEIFYEIYFHNSFINLVLEYMPYDLAGLINREYKFTENQVESIGSQLITGLAYIHSNKMIHRDIKPANILLSREGIVKIADFGLCREKSCLMSNNVCTTWYRPPELLLGDTIYTSRADSWSAACVILEMTMGHPPFKGRDEISQVKEIFSVLGRPDISHSWDDLFDLEKYPLKILWSSLIKEEFGKYIPKNLLIPITEMLRLNKNKRLSCANASELQFIKEASEIHIFIDKEDTHEYKSSDKSEMNVIHLFE